MTEKTEVILETLVSTGAALNKRGIVINASLRGDELSYKTVQRHLENLEDYEFVSIVEESGPWYVATDLAKEFVKGDLDARELDDPE